MAALWLLFSSSWAMVPIRLLVTLVHEANHAVAAELVGGDVRYAAIAADVSPLSSWMWAGIWLVVGVGACVLGVWAALSGDRRSDQAGELGVTDHQ